MDKTIWNEKWDAGGAFNEHNFPDKIHQIALNIHQLGQKNDLWEITAEDVVDMIKIIIQSQKDQTIIDFLEDEREHLPLRVQQQQKAETFINNILSRLKIKEKNNEH